MLVDLVLDLLGGVRHVHGGVGQRAGHLATATLQGREELAVQQRGLHVAQTRGNVSVGESIHIVQ